MIKSWIAQYDNTGYYNWAIELNDLEQPIGNISVVSIDEKTESIELGYCLGSQFFNKGYMTEALTAIIRFSSMRSVPDVYGPDMTLKIQIPAR